MLRVAPIYFFMLAVLLFSTISYACVGKTLHIGALAGQESELLAELMSQIVSERTGTTVKITIYKESRSLYDAVKKGDVGLLVEHPAAALSLLGKPQVKDQKSAVTEIRKEYRQTLNLIWLEPFHLTRGYAPVISADTLQSLPALPKLINKLPTALTEAEFQKLIRSTGGTVKPQKAARAFLQAKKLI